MVGLTFELMFGADVRWYILYYILYYYYTIIIHYILYYYILYIHILLLYLILYSSPLLVYLPIPPLPSSLSNPHPIIPPFFLSIIHLLLSPPNPFSSFLSSAPIFILYVSGLPSTYLCSSSPSQISDPACFIGWECRVVMCLILGIVLDVLSA